MDVEAATAFVTTHARLLDRHRLAFLVGQAPATRVLTALDAYANPDGGYGWALEPDCRSTTSQPVGAMHALQILADVRDASDRPLRLLDWLATISVDGGVPFALPFPDTDGSAPHWTTADPKSPSLQMTTQLAAHAHRLARHRPDLAGHPWLAAATTFCLNAVAAMPPDPHAYEVLFAVQFADAAPAAAHLLPALLRHVTPDGPTRVTGGAEGESLHLLDFSPYPDAPSRSHFPATAVTADRSRLTTAQRPDGGWTVDYPVHSEAARLEWRGIATVQAVAILRDTPR